MSNVDNEGLRTLDEVRADRFHAEMDVRPSRDARIGRRQTTRLNPGELEEIEEAAKLGHGISPGEALAMTGEIRDMSHRIAVRFNETAEARRAVRDLCQEIASLQTQLDARGPMADLGQLADAIVERDRAVRDAARLREDRERIVNRYLELDRSAKTEVEQLRTQLKDARVQLANLRQELEARYTKAQVADLQTAEATLVSRPLRDRITDLENRVAEMVAEIQEANRRRAAANQRAGRASRDLERLERTIRHLQGTARIREDVVADLESRNQRLVNEMAQLNREKDSKIADASRELEDRETEIELLEVALKDWMNAGQKIGEVVFDGRTMDALTCVQDRPMNWPQASTLAKVVQAVQATMPAYRPAQGSSDVPTESS